MANITKQASTRFSIVKRSKGQSAVEKASYISRSILVSEYDGQTYRPKYHEDLVHSEISLPQNAPREYADRATLWNAVELSEKGQKSQLARMLKASLPNEWSYELAEEVVRDYVQRKSALRTRRLQGKYMATTPPFGYRKDENDHNHLVIDEVTAPVVELIFSIAEEGVGLHTICNRLRQAKVLKPSFYKNELFERFNDEEKMYDWDTAYVSKILHNPVYAGNLTVAERPTKTMRSKKREYIPFAEREIVYGTHEPIIEQSRWDNVQEIMAERPPIIGDSTNGYDNIFRGIIKCADCGSAMLAKVENKRKRNNVLDKTFYCCTKYRKFGKKACSAHNIEARTVHEVVLADIQRHAGQALADRKAMVTEIAERLNVQLSADREQQKKELRQYKQRVSEIENLYAKLYEDMTRKLITEKRFQMLSARYDSEQEELSAKIKELEKSATADREQLSSIEQFAEQISGYAGITELNYKIVHQLIDKILISEPVEINGEKIQRLTIHYKFIGALETLE